MKRAGQWLIVGLGLLVIILALWLILWAVNRYEYKGVLVLFGCELALALPFGARRLRIWLAPRREAQKRLARLMAVERLHLAWFADEEEAKLAFSAEICGYEGLELLWLTDIEPREAIGGVMACLGRELTAYGADWRSVSLEGRLELVEERGDDNAGEFCFYIERFRLEESKRWHIAREAK